MSRILFLIFLFPVALYSQRGTIPITGIIPFTGIVYESHGIIVEGIEATLDGETWTSNRLPVNVEMKIKATKPRGFVVEDEMVFPGIQVLILTMSNDTLANLENIFGEQSIEGIDSALLNKLSVTLTFDPENSKPGDSLRIVSRFFDTKSAADLYTRLDLVITEPNIPLETTTSTSAISVQGKYRLIASGMEADDVSSTLYEAKGFDTPFQKIRIGSLTDLTEEEFKSGSVTLFFYDSNLRSTEIKLSPSKITIDKGPTANSILLLVNVSLIGDIEKIRLRWDSKDKLKVFDLVTGLE